MTERESTASEGGRARGEAAWSNWSGHLECRPSRIFAPTTREDLCSAVAEASEVRVAGSGHSFTELVPTDQLLISLENWTGLESADSAEQRARVRAGTTIRDLGAPLADAGLALANQGDIDAQALAGAVATATHGTGRDLGCIASRVTGFTMVTATGDLVRASATERPDLLAGGRVGLGALGVVTDIEIDAEERYNLRERVWSEPLPELLERWEALSKNHRHFEFFAFPFTGRAMAKTLDREPYDRRTGEAHKAADSSGGGFAQLLELNCTDPEKARDLFSSGLASARPTEDFGPSHVVFPSERTDRFNEMEYSVPLENGAACLLAVLRAIEEADLPVLFPIEFRTVAADDLWLSPFYERDSISLSVHQYAKQSFEPVFAVAEPVLRAHGGRPHWGKVHGLGPEELAALYPRWGDFLALRRELDPDGKFLNPYLRSLFGT